MMYTLYKDKELTQKVSNYTLFEGIEYYVDVSTSKKEDILKWISEEQIGKYIDYHPRNVILKMRFDLVVGYINILGNVYDIRSSKLLDNESGNTQFKILLNEIVEISNNLTFTIKGSSFAWRESLPKFNINLVEQLDYFYQLVFEYPKNSNLSALINQCIRNPNITLRITEQQVLSGKSRHVPNNYYSRIAQVSEFVKIEENETLLSTSLATKIKKRSGKDIFPIEVLNIASIETHDNLENRFLCFFLEDINTICLKVISNDVDNIITDKAKRLRARINFFLQNPFFKEISKLSYMPSSSSVLLKKSGYREIYYHYVQSKLMFKPLIDEQKRILHKSRLKNIATLYEIWVYFKIAQLLLKSTSQNKIFYEYSLQNGTIIETLSLEVNNLKLYYNKTFSRVNGKSYSLSLRPDVTLEFSDGTYFFFDAKYKFNSWLEDNELYRTAKSVDIHKMHTYLDAIKGGKAAIVIYPGTESIFFNKTGVMSENAVIDITDEGVGAIPLQPNGINQVLKELLDMFK